MQVQALNDITKRYDVELNGASKLADLTDVDVSNLTDGDTLKYDGANEKWVSQAGGGSGGDAFVLVKFKGSYNTAEKDGDWTYQEILEKYKQGKIAGAILNSGNFDYYFYPEISYNPDSQCIAFEKFSSNGYLNNGNLTFQHAAITVDSNDNISSARENFKIAATKT